MHLAAAKLVLLTVAAAAAACSSCSFSPPAATAASHALEQLRPDSGASCLPHERDALLAFKQGITGDDKGLLVSWRRGQEEDCCQWRGVVCSNQTGHVVKLDLGYLALQGQLINPSLLSLEQLESLDLSRNWFPGSSGSLPAFIGCFKNLRYLDLSFMSLVSTLSRQPSNLPKLEYLDLTHTDLLLAGEVPHKFANLDVFVIFSHVLATDISWLAHLQLLEYLDLSNINLSMAVDWPSVFNTIPSLKALYLSSCSLPGTSQSMAQLNLTNIVELDVSYNQFDNPLGTSSVLAFLGSMENIRYLDLSATSILSGRVPPQLGNLSNLRHLGLSSMPNMYSTDISWLTHLHQLEYIDMGGVNLSTITDWPHVVNMIPSLKALCLQECSLQSANQSLAHLNLTKLEELDLSANYFGHPIASSWFWKITSIKGLSLEETYLHGPFPDALGEMTSLQWLEFYDNGNLATMTVDLKNLCELEALLLDGSLSNGNITEFIEKLPSNLIYLDLESNNMTGVLPNTMEHLTSLATIFLSNNSISGTISPEVLNLTSLQRLYLDYNRLNGQIPLLPESLLTLDISVNNLSGHLPVEFGAPNLIELILSSNYITDHIPSSICKMQKLRFLDLSDNSFDGELPRMPNLFYLLLSNNRFSGKFPSWLRSLSTLVFLDLSWNNFDGILPTWIGDLRGLRFVQLSHNMFYGDIPVSITNLTQLQLLNLGGNNLSGPIPKSLSNLVGMALKHPDRPGIDWYDGYAGDVDVFLMLMQHKKLLIVLSMVMKHQELKYQALGVSDMVGIDLSLNHLTGEIPAEITSLDGLKNFNLSWNHLSGKIPENIGAIKSLESLDLSSNNNISGEIPPSLSEITFLSFLELSYNNLVGRIPQGSQLDSLYSNRPFMYDGNSGLCGPPLQRNCSGNNALEHDGQKKSVKDLEPTMFFYFGLVSGFVVGLWVVFCAILFKRSWRVAYVRQFDKLYDKAYVFVAVTSTRFARQATTN